MEISDYLKHPIDYYKKWQYKNTTLLILSLIVFFYFSQSEQLQSIIKSIGNLGYIGAFITGIFFVFTFTIAPAAVILFDLANVLNPYEVAFFAGLGGVVGDYIILKFFRDKVFYELKPLINHFGGRYISSLFKTPYFGWLTPFIGILLLAAPIPDEIGVGILGLSKLKTWHFLAIAFILDSVGVFIVVAAARIF